MTHFIRRMAGGNRGALVVRVLGLIALASLNGVVCCPDGTIEVVAHDRVVWIGTSVDLAFRYDGELISSPKECRGHWYVNGVEGGTEATGTITSCGRYTAPANAPAEDVLIEANEYGAEGCYDCCPYASMRITVIDIDP